MTSDSYVPKLRYDARYMTRSPSESSFCAVPACAMHAPPPQACEYAAVASVVGPVKVEFAEFAKSTWKRQVLSAFVPKFVKYPAAPAGGAAVVPSAPFAPSRSAGRRLATVVDWLEHCIVAAPPARPV